MHNSLHKEQQRHCLDASNSIAAYSLSADVLEGIGTVQVHTSYANEAAVQFPIR